jgi:TP901 family phage tail tape measure protein
MADLNVILNGRARDRGLRAYLRNAVRMTEDLSRSAGKADRALGRLSVVPAGAMPGGGRARAGRAAGEAAPRRRSARTVDEEVDAIKRLEIKPARRRVSSSASFSKAIDAAMRQAEREARAMERSAKAAEKKAKSQEDAARKAEASARQFSSVLNASLRDAPAAFGRYAKANMRPMAGGADPGASRGGGGGSGRGRNVELGANLAIAGQEFEQLGAKTEQGLRSSYEAFRDYETAIAEVTTVTSSISEKQIKEITNQALATFGGQPVDQVRAFYEVVSAGAMDAKSATEQLHAANLLAVGGRASVETSVQALSKGVANFASQGETANTVADSLFVAVQLGNARVEEMARALPNVASAASQAGLTLDETNASIAVLSKRMGTAQIGSNALQQALSNIQKPTKGAREEAERLGVDFSVAGVKAAGSWDAFIDTIANNPNFDENTLAKLFDSSEARSAIGNLIDGNKDLETTMVAMSAKEGAAAAATARMMDTTAQRAAQLEAKWGMLKIQAGEALIPALTDLAAELGPIIEGTTLWMKENGDSAAILAKYAIGITVVSKALGVLMSATSMVSSITGVASGALSSFGGTASKVGGQSDTAAGKIGKLSGAVGGANVVFAAATALILGFELALANASQSVEVEHDRLDKLNKSTEEGGLGASFQKMNEKGEMVDKTEEELLMERRQRLIEDVNAKSKQRAVGGGYRSGDDSVFGRLKGGAAGAFNAVTGVSEDLERQERQAQLDLANFDAQFGDRLGLSSGQRQTATPLAERSNVAADWMTNGMQDQAGGGLGEMLELMRQQIDLNQRIAENTAASGKGPSMEAGLT